MMTGTVSKMQLMLPVVFVLADGSQMARELVVDTGFTGGLSLSAEMIEELGLPYFRRLEAELADGKTNRYSAHLATILWHEKALEVVTYAIGRSPSSRHGIAGGKPFVRRLHRDGFLHA